MTFRIYQRVGKPGSAGTWWQYGEREVDVAEPGPEADWVARMTAEEWVDMPGEFFVTAAAPGETDPARGYRVLVEDQHLRGTAL